MSHPDGDNVDLEWIDSVADRFEAAWRLVEEPSITSFLTEVAGQRRVGLIRELVKIDLAWRSKKGESRQVEAYVADFPELLAADGTIPGDLILYAERIRDRHRDATT